MSDAQHFRRPAPSTLLIALCIAAIVATVTLPTALRGGFLTPDATEHLSIAHNWVEGAGFVDPVQWYYLLDQPPPIPATAARAPVVSLLASIPLRMGATVTTVIVLHAVWGGAVAALVFWIGSRFMRRRAAAAAALILCVSPAWVMLSSTPLTEVTATAAYVLVLATAGGALRSRNGAILCAALTLLAYLTRPQLAALSLAIWVAAALEIGPQKALRNSSLWTYALTFLAGVLCVGAIVEAMTGLALYAGYEHQSQVLSIDKSSAVWSYGHAYPGTMQFIQENASQIATITGERIGQLAGALFTSPQFNYIGWLAIPAVLFGLLRKRDGALEHRINAFSILGFSVVLIATYSAFDPSRYPLLVAVPASLGGLAWLDAWLRSLERGEGRGPGARNKSLLGYTPLLAVLLAFVLLPTWRYAGSLPNAWAIYQLDRSAPAPLSNAHVNLLDFCKHIHPDALVASLNPWGVLLTCGNAGLRLPVDLHDPAQPHLLARFLTERAPEYILLGPGYPQPWRNQLIEYGMQPVFEQAGSQLLATVNPSPRSRPWNAPTPLRCAGRPASCAAEAGR